MGCLDRPLVGLESSQGPVLPPHSASSLSKTARFVCDTALALLAPRDAAKLKNSKESASAADKQRRNQPTPEVCPFELGSLLLIGTRNAPDGIVDSTKCSGCALVAISSARQKLSLWRAGAETMVYSELKRRPPRRRRVWL